MTKEKRIEELLVLLERRTKFFTKNKELKVRIFQRKVQVLKNGENILHKGQYVIDLETTVGWTGKYRFGYRELVGLFGWTGKYRLRYVELVGLVEGYLDWPKK